MDHEEKSYQEEEIRKPSSKIPSPKSQQPKKGKGFLFLLLIILCLIGFLYIQQLILDVEAEAIVSARMTVEALKEDVQESETALPKSIETTASPTIVEPSATPDPEYWHTQTVSAQLTAVSEFQSTTTAE